MKTLDVEQGSGAWMAARCGVVTASDADELITPEFKVRTGQKPRAYFFKKLAERKLNYSEDMLQMGGTWAMEQGQVLEKHALPWFEFQTGIPVRRAGFCTSDDGRVGCSPDGLGPDCGVEIKSPQPKTHLRYLLDGVLPDEHAAQVHFGLFVTGLPRWYFISYHTHLPKLVVEVKRDEEIQKTIKRAVEGFNAAIDEAMKKLTELEDKR